MSFLQPTQTLKHYRVVKKLGQGGMGHVYLAEDTKLGRHVAIKLLPEETTKDERAKSRLLQEARSASALNHANIVTIYSIDDHDGVDFIVMEYIEGETLRKVVEQGPLDLLPMLDVGAQIADALAAAHAVGIVHRDIKSENILLTSSFQPKVLDFGLAKMSQTSLSAIDQEAPTKIDLTGAGVVLGTVYYMSPEQTRGEPLDSRSDIFSLGCVLYETATGTLPFRGPSILSIAHDIASVDPVPPSRIRPGLPMEFDMIVERALAKDRERRYRSAAELAEALRSLKGVSAEGLQSLKDLAESSRADAEPESFVGREPELTKLNELLAQSVNGAGRVVFITGEPGIGKSSLVREFLRRSRKQHVGITIAHGRSVEQYGTGEAYLPFLEAIGSLLTGPHRERIIAHLRTYAPTWCLQFPAAFASSIAIEKLQQETAGASKERMLREMGDMLAALSTSSPVILLLEDLHWSDPSSVDLLRHLAHRFDDQRLLIIGTVRQEELELTGHPLKMCKLEMQAHKTSEEVALGSLAQAHITSYLDSNFRPNDFPRDLTALIYNKTEGHPLFAISLIQFLAESGDITRVNERWSLARPLSKMGLEAPENVRSMIRKKIQALAEEDRRALQYASVEGEEFLSTVAAKLLGIDDLDLEERLATVERTHGLIEARGEEELPDGSLATRYRFAHALYQDVLYGDLVAKRRVLLHRQAGEQLALHHGRRAPRIAAKLAVHFERGREFPRAIEYLIHAGDNAARLYANTEAAEHYGHALKLVKKNEDDNQDETRLTLYHKRGKINFALGKFQKSVDDFTEMLEVARKLGSTAQESAALNALNMTLFYSHRLDEITARADEILRTAERAGSESLRIEAMLILALKHLGDGELDKARPMLDQIVEGARKLNHQSILLSSLAWRGLVHFFQTEYPEAEEMLKETQSLATEMRDSFFLLESYFVLGMVRGNLGRMSEALETFREGLELSSRYEEAFWGPRMPNCVGWIYRELQDFSRAIEHDERGLKIGQEVNVLEAQANSLINLGIDRGRAGLESESTMEAFREVEAIFQQDSWFRWRYSIRLHAGKSEHWLAQGDLDKAEEYARRLLEVATHYGARKYKAVAHKLLSEVALARNNTDAAEAELNSALAQLETHPVLIVAWKVYAALGDLHARKGNTQGAREAFARAVSTINTIADGVTDDEQRALFMSSPAIRKVLESNGEFVEA